MKISETHIEKACSDFLALDGWRCLKTDPVSRREWGKGFGEKGMADCLYVRYLWPKGYSEVVWIEWKSAQGKAATHQKMWHLAERARGALTLIAGEDFERSYDGFVEWYRTSGLLRRVGL